MNWRANLKSVKHQLNGLEEDLKSRGDVPEVGALSLPSLTQMMWGFKAGTTIIGGRTSIGKTSFVCQLALDFVQQGIQTLFLSLEDTEESMLEKMFCNLHSVDNYVLLRGGIKIDGVKASWEVFKEDTAKLPLLITCGMGHNFQDINSLIEELDPMPKVVILDYVQLVRTGEQERQNLNEYIRKFDELMRKNKIRGILSSQANRSVKDENERRPTLENLKGTGSLEEIAEAVLLLYWEYFYTKKPEKKNNYDILVAKNKKGRTGVISLKYEPEFYRFSEVQEFEEYVK